jgi:hypothetical protein
MWSAWLCEAIARLTADTPFAKRRNCLHVRGVRKQVEASQSIQLVAGIEQHSRVAGQRRYVAGDVDDS